MPWHPQIYFGTVNFNDQLTHTDQWQQTAARVDGMLLHVHFFVRHLNTPENQMVDNALDTIRGIAPNLKKKKNLIELTYHITDSTSSPEEIARMHARNIADIEAMGIPIVGVNVDWILSGIPVQVSETVRKSGETDEVYYERVLTGVLSKSARYLRTFRAAGRREKLYAVFPPVYINEGRWQNARKEKQGNITVSRILNGLFDIGFDGFTADTPLFVMTNPAYVRGGYFDALRSIEAACRKRRKSFGVILNDDNKETGAAYDTQFARATFQALDLIQSAGLRPDQIISESWYKGPFVLVPETTPGTYTNTVLKLVQRLRQR
jgi:hypothetical protein